MDLELMEDGLHDIYTGANKLAKAFGLNRKNTKTLLDEAYKVLANKCVELKGDQDGIGALLSSKGQLEKRRDELTEQIVRERGEL